MSIIAKVVAGCNMACRYCYLPPTSGNAPRVIPEDALVRLIRGTVAMGITHVQLIWHGGEPLLPGIEFYERQLQLQSECGAPWQNYQNVLQTNGTLIDQHWIDFFRVHSFGIGISIDGHAEIHDVNRRSGLGGPSHERVLRSYVQLHRAGCDGGVCAVVSRESLGHARTIVEFFAAQDLGEVDFLPCFASEGNPESRSHAITPEEYADFLIEAFDAWVAIDRPEFQVRLFRNALTLMMGGRSDFCMYTAAKCTNFIAVDTDGQVYPCDNFVGLPQWRLGSLMEMELPNILAAERHAEYLAAMSTLDPECRDCRWLRMCWGGCTYHRHLADPSLHIRTIFCETRKRIFGHIAATLGLAVSPATPQPLGCSSPIHAPMETETEAYLEVGKSCNSKCIFCAADSTQSKDVATPGQLRGISAARNIGSSTLIISGGEATIHDGIVETIAYAQNLGFDRIHLQTNGRSLANITTMRSFLAAGVTEFGISLHGADADTHDRLTGVSGGFTQTVRALENLRILFGPNPPVATNTVMTPENLPSLGRVVELLAALNVSTIKLAYLHATGRATRLLKRGRWPSMTKTMPSLRAAISRFERQAPTDTSLAVEGIPACVLDGLAPYSSDSSIRPVLVIAKDGALRSFHIREERVKAPQCQECRLDRVCLGPWRQYPQVFGWHEFVPLPATRSATISVTERSLF